MAEEIKAGDTVELKSGGPLMTVERVFAGIKNEPKAACQWFEGSKAMSENFSVSSLKKVDGGAKFVKDFEG
jgi:uncharacterized protein YodC (DUF2158 family)